jgi:hypothetical protein
MECSRSSARPRRCYNELKGGIFVLQNEGETLLLPPYNLHTTFSIGGSIICVYDFDAVEFFPVTISCLHVEIAYIDNHNQNEIDRLREHGLNLGAWLDGLERTLRDHNNKRESLLKRGSPIHLLPRCSSRK